VSAADWFEPVPGETSPEKGYAAQDGPSACAA